MLIKFFFMFIVVHKFSEIGKEGVQITNTEIQLTVQKPWKNTGIDNEPSHTLQDENAHI